MNVRVGSSPCPYTPVSVGATVGMDRACWNCPRRQHTAICDAGDETAPSAAPMADALTRALPSCRRCCREYRVLLGHARLADVFVDTSRIGTDALFERCTHFAPLDTTAVSSWHKPAL